jgi:hypothetical protein
MSDLQAKWFLIGMATMLGCVILGHIMAAIFGESSDD